MQFSHGSLNPRPLIIIASDMFAILLSGAFSLLIAERIRTLGRSVEIGFGPAAYANAAGDHLWVVAGVLLLYCGVYSISIVFLIKHGRSFSTARVFHYIVALLLTLSAILLLVLAIPHGPNNL